MKKFIDINADVGERPEALKDGSEERLMGLICSANVACGGHAGDENTMNRVIGLAKKYSISLGAHPGFPDKASFGRAELSIPLPDLERSVYNQVMTLASLAKKQGVELQHVKPHGALYNLAAKEPELAGTIANGIALYSTDVLLIGLAGSLMLEVWKERGFRVAGEAFADRRYESDGSLRSRKFPDALISDPIEAAQQADRIAEEKIVIAVDGTSLGIEAQTLCVHSDTPNAVEILMEIRKTLAERGIELRPMTEVI